MKKEKICSYCQKEIDLENEKHVLLGTYRGENILDESYFHFQCFQDWYNSKIIEKTKNTIQDASKKVMGIFGGMRKIAINNSGDEAVVDLGFDINNEIPNMQEEIPYIDLTLNQNKKKKDGKTEKRK